MSSGGMSEVSERWHWVAVAELPPGKQQGGGGAPCRRPCKWSLLGLVKDPYWAVEKR